MNTIYVKTETKKYPIYIKYNFSGFSDAVLENGIGGNKLFIITDSNVGKIYVDELKKEAETVFDEIYVYTFNAGEKNKNLDTINEFYDFFLKNLADRKSVVACLGGGVCGDMAGFAAATYLRGIKFIQIPTSLLAQVDSSVGGKVGVDFKGHKNIIGAFYQPDFVYISVETLSTLPQREFNSGMAEFIKYGPINSYKFFEYISDNREAIKERDKDTMGILIRKCCEIKADIVSKDEMESGLREILNFGHTIGHAIESRKFFEFLHGECVALGMRAMFALCLKNGTVSRGEHNAFLELLDYFELPSEVSDLAATDIYKQMFFDKKVKNNKINFITLKSFGEPVVTSKISEEDIFNTINTILD